jgi:hypothetical protein
MGARAVRGRSGWSDGGSDTWDIEIPSFDKASLYQTMVTEVPDGQELVFLPKIYQEWLLFFALIQNLPVSSTP